MYTLYARKGAGSAAVEAILALCNAPHEIIDVPKTDQAKAPDWYFTINPRGEVPTLGLPDGTVLTESGAMALHLADCFPAAKLAPAKGTTAHALYMRAIIYMAANTYPTDLRYYYPDRYSTDASDAQRIKDKAVLDMNRDFDVFNGFLGGGRLCCHVDQLVRGLHQTDEPPAKVGCSLCRCWCQSVGAQGLGQ
jgi:glutathione S-transferase